VKTDATNPRERQNPGLITGSRPREEYPGTVLGRIYHRRVVKSTVDLAALRDTISSPRLDACRRLPSDDDLTLLGRYAWNVALSEALYPILQSLEIALRNGIHRSAAAPHSHTFSPF